MIEIANEMLIVGAALVVFIIVCLARVVLGKTIADRVVAVDTINTQLVAALVVLGAAFSQISFIDIAVIYAMLAFVSTLYIAKYLEDKA
ncbi:MAG: cation:proton antiporter [Candidatus Diapherotrites archaeon]|uniref:Cation:proton antiporter n=1 Tax=Candidatus Iainarchaeum sp. TaxID=3101447 RepID=A0A938YS24_9ARCH|nr:cation:proton antiporter [Candidatus Diapherotrites archaeon]